jgi:hypothetical protein
MKKDNQVFDLLEWVSTGSIATREVTLFIDHETYQATRVLVKELRQLENVDRDLPVSVDMNAERVARIEAIKAELAELNDKLAASKMVWTMRALSDVEIQESMDAVPGPRLPIKPDGVLTEKTQTKWEARANEYGEAKVKADGERRLWVVQKATQNIVTTAGETDTVTIETLKGLQARPHGAAWINKLYAAVEEATSQEVTPDLP